MHNTIVGTHDLSPEEIVDFCNYARREYYLRPAYFLVKLKTILVHPSEIRRTIKAFLNFYKYLFNKDNKKNKEKFDYRIKNFEKESSSKDNLRGSSKESPVELKKVENLS